jgi:U3 small nucleolar ribonucleoprotein protein IMP4
MLRRNQRERREYLYRKSLESTAQAVHERKQTLKTAIETGRPIPGIFPYPSNQFPGQLRQDAEAIRRELAYDEHNDTSELSTHIDDEYATAGVTDPKILITTSRDPSSRYAPSFLICIDY